MARYFDGNDYGVCADSVDFSVPDDDWYRLILYKCVANPGSSVNYLYNHNDLGTNDSLNIVHYQASHANANKILAYVKDGAGDYYIVVTTIQITADDNWHVIVVQRVSGVLWVYIDNVSGGADNDAAVDAVNPSNPVNFGRLSSGSAFIDGHIAEIAGGTGYLDSDARAALSAATILDVQASGNAFSIRMLGNDNPEPDETGANDCTITGAIQSTHPFSSGDDTIATAGVAKVHPKATGESGTTVSCAGAARAAVLAFASAGTLLLGTAAACRASPRAMGQSDTPIIVPSQGVSRVHSRLVGQAETTVASVGVSRGHARTETGEVIIGVVTRAARVHPRAFGLAQVLVDGEGVSKAIARAAGQSATTLEITGAPALVSARAIGEAQLASGNVACQGVSKAHPAATAEAETTVQGQGKSQVQSRGIGQASTVVECGGLSRVQPRGVAQSTTTHSTAGTPSKAHTRAVGNSGLVGDGASSGVAQVCPRAQGSAQAKTIHKQWRVKSNGRARYCVRATG